MKIPNFLACYRYCEGCLKASKFLPTSHIEYGPDDILYSLEKEESMAIHQGFTYNLLKAKLFKIPQEIANLFSLTDNNYYENRRLPYPVIFLECKIPIYGRYFLESTSSILKGNNFVLGLLLSEIPKDMITKINESGDGIYYWPSFEEAINSDNVEIHVYGLCKTPISEGTFMGYELLDFFLSELSEDSSEINQLGSLLLTFLIFLMILKLK